MKTTAALIVGFTIQGLAIARSLSRFGIPVYVVEKELRAGGILRSSPLAFTSHATFFSSNRLLGSGLIDTLMECRSKIPEQHVVLFPASDNTVRVLAEHWRQLNGEYLMSWSDCRSEVASIIQKGALPEYCDAAGMRYPRTIAIHTDADCDRVPDAIDFPVLVKPNKPASSFKTQICRGKGELVSFLKKERNNWPLVVQEWIDGPDDCLFAYTCLMDQGKEVFGMSSRKVRASPPGLGRATVIQTFDDAGVQDESRKLLRILNISGPVATEFKKDRNGQYWFIEANVGRTEYCVDLAVQAGFDIPVLEYHMALNKPLPDVPGKVDSAVWFDTEKEPLCYLSFCLQQRTLRPFGKKPVFPYFGKEKLTVNIFAFVHIIKDFSLRAKERAKSIWHKVRPSAV